MSQWIRAFAQTTTYLGVIMIAAIWGGIYFLSTEAHDRAYEDGLRQGSNMARVFDEYIARVISGVDNELLVLRKLYQQDSEHFDFDHWVDRATTRSNPTVHFSSTGPDGIVRLSSLGPVSSLVDILMQGSSENVETLHRLRKLGIAIVLDDFGTGYSSLSHLRMFPFDQIKIDRSFVSELSSNRDCAAIVSAVASLGRSLHVDTVAEGVETEEQLALARVAGCTHAQGFLFGRPCPARELGLTRLAASKQTGAAA
jgi:hypothetical protein